MSGDDQYFQESSWGWGVGWRGLGVGGQGFIQSGQQSVRRVWWMHTGTECGARGGQSESGIWEDVSFSSSKWSKKAGALQREQGWSVPETVRKSTGWGGRDDKRENTAGLLGIHTWNQIKQYFPSSIPGEKLHFTANISNECLLVLLLGRILGLFILYHWRS